MKEVRITDNVYCYACNKIKGQLREGKGNRYHEC